MSLTKIDVTESIREKIGIPKKDCSRIVESLFGIIKSEFA
jgi:nucleoid DNA-binding protein